MLKSNAPVVSANIYSNKPQLRNSISQNMATLDNIKVREKMRSMQNAQAFGSSTDVAKQALNLHLSQKAKNKNMVPLVRNKTARDYATK